MNDIATLTPTVHKRKMVVKGTYIEISGTGVLDSAMYDLKVKSPIFWYAKSEELLFSAKLLNVHQDEMLKKHSLNHHTFSVVRLLCGYALENIFKAIIAPNSTITSSGKLPKNLREHNLRDLCNAAGVEISDDQGKILDFLTQHVLAYGRYHIHLCADKMQNNSNIKASQELYNEVEIIWKLAKNKLLTL